MTRRRSFTSHACRPLVAAPGVCRKSATCVALEPHALGVGGNQNAEGLQAGVLDLILQIGGDLHLRFADGGVLQAGHLNPRVHLLDVQREGCRRLQDAKASTPFLPDARLLRVQLRVAFARRRPAGASLAPAQSARCPAVCRPRARRLAAPSSLVAVFTPGPARVMANCLPPLRLAGKMQRDDAPGVGLQFRPLAQGRTADGFDVEARRHQKAQVENARARDVHREIVRQHGAVFAERQRVLGFHAHIRLHRRGLQGQRWRWCPSNGTRGARSGPGIWPAARPRRRRENPPG